MGHLRQFERCPTLFAVDDRDVIDREEVVLIMGLLGGIRSKLEQIRRFLEDEDGEEEADS